MASKLRTTPTRSDTESTRFSRLISALVSRLPGGIRREVTPTRSDSESEVRAKWQRGVTEGVADLYDRKADKAYVDRRRDILSYEKLFPQPMSQWDIVVPDSTGLQIMSSLVLSSLSGSEEPVEHQLVPDESAPDARCSIFFNETVSGKVRLQLG